MSPALEDRFFFFFFFFLAESSLLFQELSLVKVTGGYALGVAVLRLSYSAACGIFPDQGLNPCLLPWQVDSYPLGHWRSPICWVF